MRRGALLRRLRRFLHGRLAWARQDLAAIGDLADHLADGDSPAAALEVLGVGHVDEALAVVVAHALHPVLARGVERPFEADPLLAETADGRKAAAAVVTVTTAEADTVESAALVAVILAVPAAAGAVYAPEEVIVPADAVQVTKSFAVVP